MGRRRKAWLLNGTGVRKDSNGKPLPGYVVRFHEYTAGGRYTPQRTFQHKRDAEAFVRRRNAMIDLGMLGQVVPITIEEALDAFLRGRSSLTRSSRNDYTKALGLLVAYAGDVPIGDITPLHIEEMVSRRLAKVSQATVAKHLRNLKTFWGWAIKHGYASRNVVAEISVRMPAVHVRARPNVTAAQLEALLLALDTDDRRIAAWLALTTGMDAGVIRSLCTHHIDRDAGVIRLQRPKTRRQKKPKILTLPIHCQLLPLLLSRLHENEPYRPILAGLHREPKKRDWWVIATEKAGIPDLWFRDLRAVFAGLAQREAGLTLPQTQRQLGHSDPTLTSNFYEMPDPDIARKLSAITLPAFGRIQAQTTAAPATGPLAPP